MFFYSNVFLQIFSPANLTSHRQLSLTGRASGRVAAVAVAASAHRTGGRVRLPRTARRTAALTQATGCRRTEGADILVIHLNNLVLM